MIDVHITKLDAIMTNNATALVTALTIIKKNILTLVLAHVCSHCTPITISDITKFQTVEESMATFKAIVVKINDGQVLRAHFCKIQNEKTLHIS